MPNILIMNYCLITIFSFCTLILHGQTIDTVSVDVPKGKLEGTLSVVSSDKPSPVVYIIAGSGSNDRNGNPGETGSNCHLMLSDSLLKYGISTLRVDKRMSGNSKLAIESEEEVTFDDFVSDASAWIDFLVDREQFSEIIIIGHSQGGLVAMLAAQNKKHVSKIVSLAGQTSPILEVLRKQLYAQFPKDKYPKYSGALEPILESLERGETVDTVPMIMQSIARPSVQPFLISWSKYNPTEEIRKLDIPISIIQGTTDIQVTVEDAQLLYKAQPNASLSLIEGMNHVLKPAPMDRMEQMKTYSDPELPIVGELVTELVKFIKR